jgi:hypothetical protein
MRSSLFVLFVVVAAGITFSLTQGQDQAPPVTIPPATAPSATTPPVAPPAPRVDPALAQTGFSPAPTPITDKAPPRAAATTKVTTKFTKLNELQQQFLLTGLRGTHWLSRMHRTKGRLRNGILPALNKDMEGDSFYRQAAAAAVLAQTGRVSDEERFQILAAQTILSLLEDTCRDAKDDKSRYVSIPGAGINRLGATASVVVAIHELSNPQKDLLERSEEMCRFLQSQARDDGSLASPIDGVGKDEGAELYPGLAMQALMASARRNKDDKKIQIVKKALPYYHKAWNNNRCIESIPAQATAFADLYQLTKDKACAECVFAMGDWLLTLQYTKIDPRRPLWYGGFMSCREGRTSETAPDVESAIATKGLIQACRLAKEMGDVSRHQQYSEAIEKALQFLATLQYSDSGTQHYSDWFRESLVGGFHRSHSDGNLRIDSTEQCVAAMMGYIEMML